jgi:hypothetical protein
MPTRISSGDLIIPPVGTFARSPTRAVNPIVESSGANFRPYAEATPSPPGAAARPFGVWTTPMTTTSAFVFSAAPLRSV